MTADQIAKLNAARAADLGLQLPDAYVAHDRAMTLPTAEHAQAWDRMLKDIEDGEELAATSRPDIFDAE